MVQISPDLEALARSFAASVLSGVPVATRVPNPRPTEFVRLTVLPSAGTRDVVLFDGLLNWECWAATSTRASELVRTLAGHLADWEGAVVGGSVIYSSVPGGPGWFPDPDTASPRYTFTHALTVRTTTL